MKSLLRSYLNPGVIIAPLPFTILNGQAVDAVPVMADFSAIVAAVNANAAPLSAVPVFTGITAFTPVLAFGGSSVGIVYTVQAGAYCKLANIVFFSIDILLNNKGAAVGAATISGLPFAVAAAFPTGSAVVWPMTTRQVTFAAGVSALFNPGGTSFGILNLFSAGPFGLITNVECANNSEFIVSGFYST